MNSNATAIGGAFVKRCLADLVLQMKEEVWVMLNPSDPCSPILILSSLVSCFHRTPLTFLFMFKLFGIHVN